MNAIQSHVEDKAGFITCLFIIGFEKAIACFLANSISSIDKIKSISFLPPFVPGFIFDKSYSYLKVATSLAFGVAFDAFLKILLPLVI